MPPAAEPPAAEEEEEVADVLSYVPSVAQQAALGRAFAVASVLRDLTHRDGIAETVGWKAVEKQPGAGRTGLGVLVLAPAEPAPKKAE